MSNVQERHQLRQNIDKLSKDLQDKSEQEVSLLIYTSILSLHAKVALHEALKTHDARIKELQKRQGNNYGYYERPTYQSVCYRLRDEHYLKTKSETELQGMCSKLDSLQTETERLHKQRKDHDQELSTLTSHKQQLQDQLSDALSQLEQLKQREKKTQKTFIFIPIPMPSL